MGLGETCLPGGASRKNQQAGLSHSASHRPTSPCSSSTHHAADVVLDAGGGEEHLAQLAAVGLLVGAANARQLRLAGRQDKAGEVDNGLWGTHFQHARAALGVGQELGRRGLEGRSSRRTRLPMVPVLSSAARMPLPGVAMALALAISSAAY